MTCMNPCPSVYPRQPQNVGNLDVSRSWCWRWSWKPPDSALFATGRQVSHLLILVTAEMAPTDYGGQKIRIPFSSRPIPELIPSEPCMHVMRCTEDALQGSARGSEDQVGRYQSGQPSPCSHVACKWTTNRSVTDCM